MELTLYIGFTEQQIPVILNSIIRQVINITDIAHRKIEESFIVYDGENHDAVVGQCNRRGIVTRLETIVHHLIHNGIFLS
ncbi:MAG: hypothetical protein LKF37_11645 [Lentilactobacillus diolivorans]|uniref:Uncharacterized protein n=1 Tax=Lentilactobacillus diolivorans DSM 14421 TaxID=1423739 RepID=A0A0R1S7T3_9LACO|nr:hypothetical protein FC85_GL000771 [Lentilactobacillus diolivorans DSM 14421]MCH4165415.1 hypothetical protein [Lentilactobacillus diolivorans]RRG01227.1 MAG: hypothetical protein DUD34_12930 [Lactobacillus sp.]